MIKVNPKIIVVLIAVTLGAAKVVSAQEGAIILTPAQKRARSRERNLAVRAKLQKPCGITSEEQEITLETLREMVSHQAGVYMIIEESAKGIDSTFILPPITPDLTFEDLLNLAVEALSKPPEIVIDWAIRNQSVLITDLEGIERILNRTTVRIDVAIFDIAMEKMNELDIKVSDLDDPERKGTVLKKLTDLINDTEVNDALEIHASTLMTCNFNEEISFANVDRVSYTTDEMRSGKESKITRYNNVGVDLRIMPEIIDFRHLTLQISIQDNYLLIPGSSTRIELDQRLGILNGETVVFHNLQTRTNKKSCWMAIITAKITGV